MTKKELIDFLQNQCNAVSDDALVVFNTSETLRLCQPLERIGYGMEIEPDPTFAKVVEPPGIKTERIVIDALPKEWLASQLSKILGLSLDR